MPSIPRTSASAHLVGKNVILPLVGRRIPVVADEYSDPEKGTGAVKITPAHDFNDFEVGKRHELPPINIMTAEAAINLKDNEDFLEGLEVDARARRRRSTPCMARTASTARKLVVEMMEDGGFLEKVEPHRHAVPHGDRGGVPIEPFLTDQWYVNAAELAKPAIASVRAGPHQLRPEELGKDLFRLDGEHPALVHFAPAVVGPPDPGLVRPGRPCLRREDRGGSAARGDPALPRRTKGR